MKLGYARVSTGEQTLDIQCRRLSAAGCELLFEEKVSGAAKSRPSLEKLIEQLRKDDVLVITRLDRLARSTSELLRIVEQVTARQAGLQSLDEPWADTTTPSGKMVMTIFGGIAEFERSLILSRTQDGRQDAMARGVTFGRPSKLLPDQKELARELVRSGKSISAVARTFKVHPATIYRCLEENPALCRSRLIAFRQAHFAPGSRTALDVWLPGQGRLRGRDVPPHHSFRGTGLPMFSSQ